MFVSKAYLRLLFAQDRRNTDEMNNKTKQFGNFAILHLKHTTNLPTLFTHTSVRRSYRLEFVETTTTLSRCDAADSLACRSQSWCVKQAVAAEARKRNIAHEAA